MKNFFKGLTVFTLSLLIFPAVPWLIGSVSTEEAVPAVADIEIKKEPAEPDIPEFKIDEVNVYDPVTEREITLTAREYVASALAAQLSQDNPRELLKAQAVLMYTYILKRRADEIKSPTPDLHGCDVSTDYKKYPRLILGEKETVDISAYREIADEVAGEYLSYGGEPITVAYCRAAGLSTESALTVLGEDVPYLKAVDSFETDEYITTVSYTSDEVFARLTTTSDGYVLLGDPDGWIGISEAEPDGYVRKATLDGRFILSGSELASLLNLPSAKFTFRYSGASDRFTFTVSGCGSLVGMSQRGAAAMAAEGMDYREILGHFFVGTGLEGGGGED